MSTLQEYAGKGLVLWWQVLESRGRAKPWSRYSITQHVFVTDTAPDWAHPQWFLIWTGDKCRSVQASPIGSSARYQILFQVVQVRKTHCYQESHVQFLHDHWFLTKCNLQNVWHKLDTLGHCLKPRCLLMSLTQLGRLPPLAHHPPLQALAGWVHWLTSHTKVGGPRVYCWCTKICWHCQTQIKWQQKLFALWTGWFNFFFSAINHFKAFLQVRPVFSKSQPTACTYSSEPYLCQLAQASNSSILHNSCIPWIQVLSTVMSYRWASSLWSRT